MVLSPIACQLDTRKAAFTRIGVMLAVAFVVSLFNEWFTVQPAYKYPDYQWTFQTYQTLFFYLIPLLVTGIAYGKMRAQLTATAVAQFEHGLHSGHIIFLYQQSKKTPVTFVV
jgi:hypothetical protein